MDERSKRFALVLEHGDRSVVLARKLGAAACCIDEPVALRQPEQDLERRIVQRTTQCISNALGRRPLELEHEIADACSRESRAQKTGEEC